MSVVTEFGVDASSHDPGTPFRFEGQCPIQGWIASRFEMGRSPSASRFNWDKKVIDSGLMWFLLDNKLSTCSMI